MKIKIITITILTLIAVGLISALFIIQYNTPNEVEETSESIFTKNIIDPDRIVYKNGNRQYYQFLKFESYSFSFLVFHYRATYDICRLFNLTVYYNFARLVLLLRYLLFS